MIFKNNKFKTELHIGPDCSQYWYKNRKLHRINGPAYILFSGHRMWGKNGQTGKLYRPDELVII